MDDRKQQSEITTASPHIDWAIAPAEARWWAMDEDGSAYWYCAPRAAPLAPFWFCDQLPAPGFEYSGDWRHSLTERR